MRIKGKELLCRGVALLALAAVWTVLVCRVDVKPVGQLGTALGFAGLNTWFFRLTGVHLWLYTLTDWLGLVPVFVCLGFAGIGAVQLLRWRGLKKVDLDILLLGVYYIAVVTLYLVFEMIPINYRPVLIQGCLEASYPSSTTLLVLCVMPTLVIQARRRMGKGRTAVTVGTMIFSAAMVAGRMISGVHWLTDIIGAGLMSAGMVCLYRAAVALCCEEKELGGRGSGIS